MDCSCVYVDIDNGPEAFRSINRKACKEHKCCECGRVILKGETYRYESGIWEGEASSYKTCKDCLSIRNAFFCNGYNYGFMLEDLREYLDEVEGAVKSQYIEDLTPGAKDIVFALMDEIFSTEGE